MQRSAEQVQESGPSSAYVALAGPKSTVLHFTTEWRAADLGPGGLLRNYYYQSRSSAHATLLLTPVLTLTTQESGAGLREHWNDFTDNIKSKVNVNGIDLMIFLSFFVLIIYYLLT